MGCTKIEWTDWTVNPVVGCFNGCPYCYARKQAKRQKQKCIDCYEFKPHDHLKRLEQIKPTQKPKKIFIDSMWDWNSNGVKEEWLEEIINKMGRCKQHTFQILSKRSDRYSRFSYPQNVWLGTSIATSREIYRVKDLLESGLPNLKFVSIEPIHEEIDYYFMEIDWIIVGAETGNRKGRITPKREWIESVIDNARAENIPIFVKDNLQWEEKIQEFPVC